MRALVTGAEGFVGQWLVDRLLRDDALVTAGTRTQRPALVTLDEKAAARVQWHPCDLADSEGLNALVDAARPEAVFHLAAQSFVPSSNKDPLSTFETNIMGTARLLEAVRLRAREATVLVVGSADAYGAVSADRLPIVESTPLAPRNPYAASKAAAECVAVQYARSGWCKTIATRSFNHTGPGQSPAFAVASFASQVAAIRAGRRQPVLEVGDLSSRRDIADVRDIVDAYVALVQRGQPGRVYNVCTGSDRSMREVVVELFRIAGIQAEIATKPSLVRAVEIPALRGDPSLIEQHTGWRARIPIERTLSDMLAYNWDAAA